MAIVRKLIVHAYLALSGIHGKLRALQAMQWLEPERLRALQEQRLRRLLAHASRNVPFYRKLLAQTGVVDAHGEIHIDRFTSIPPLDKRTLHVNFKELHSDDVGDRRWYHVESGGSTGQPARVVFSDDHEMWPTLSMLFNSWTGYRVADRQITFWGSRRGIFEDSSYQLSWRARARRVLNNWELLDSYRVTPQRLREYASKVNAIKPLYLWAYTDFVYYFARFIERERLPIHRPRAIIVGATPLRPYMREVIERAFQAPVFDRYGAAEVSQIAAQCEQRRGMHISAPTHFVEILREDGIAAAPGELGEIVVTPLFNFAMPLLRYRLEDLGRWAQEPCPCGRTWPQLVEIVGRSIDVFVTRDHGLVSSGLLITMLEHINYEHGGFIERYQIIQEDLDHIRFLLIPFEKDCAEKHEGALLEIRRRLAPIVGPDVRITFEYPADIEPSPTGKYLFAISKVPRDGAGLADLFKL